MRRLFASPGSQRRSEADVPPPSANQPRRLTTSFTNGMSGGRQGSRGPPSGEEVRAGRPIVGRCLLPARAPLPAASASLLECCGGGRGPQARAEQPRPRPAPPRAPQAAAPYLNSLAAAAEALKGQEVRGLLSWGWGWGWLLNLLDQMDWVG